MLLPLAAFAARQDLQVLSRVADQFLQGELAQRAATWQLGRIDPTLSVPACPAPVAGWAEGAPTTGSTYVDLTCPSLGWRLRMPVRIQEKHLGVVLTRAVRAGEVLQPQDVRLADTGSSSVNGAILTELPIGKVMLTAAPAGSWLRPFMVRLPLVVKMNQRVRVVAVGDGFAANADGVAMGNGSAGDVVVVRMQSGVQIRGVVKADGTVEVNF